VPFGEDCQRVITYLLFAFNEYLENHLFVVKGLYLDHRKDISSQWKFLADWSFVIDFTTQNCSCDICCRMQLNKNFLQELYNIMVLRKIA
jgi:hypothetical protein